ncbi:MAG: DUF6262 family protein [Bacillota bacterium]|nr:DUF6262 family protein [Bacillota bacterium]
MEIDAEDLKIYAQEKTKMALEKTNSIIKELYLKGEKISFNSVASASGVSEAFLYSNDEIKKRIERLGEQEVSEKIDQMS